MNIYSLITVSFFWIFFSINCNKADSTVVIPPNPVIPNNEIDFWITKANQTALLQKQTTALSFSTSINNYPNIVVDTSSLFQSVDGFGYTLTGGSAYLINKMGDYSKSILLKELFGNSEEDISVSYLRISMGASDLDARVFSYNDMPSGQTDVTLSQFSLSQDTLDLIPVLKEILKVNPKIKIMASPWSPPVWMKDNGNSIGGSLLPKYYPVYANYFVKYIKAMRQSGIDIDAVTIQNEPQHGGNNPSLIMSASQQAEFIKYFLGPAFRTDNISTKIIIWDHNCDMPDYPISILNDYEARQYVDGSAFHLYAGDISALSTVKNAHPDKNLYFTEQWTGANGSFDGDFKWHIKNVIIGSMRNWSKVTLEWNMANDPNYKPHTPGGCSQCKGALTINGNVFTKNVSYYIIGQISKFVPPGSVRIGSTSQKNLQNVAFITPQGKKVLLVLNDGNTDEIFNIGFHGKAATTNLPAGSAGTFVW